MKYRWEAFLFFAIGVSFGVFIYLDQEFEPLLFYAATLSILSIASLFYQLTRILSSVKPEECVSLTWLVGSICFFSFSVTLLLEKFFTTGYITLFAFTTLLTALTFLYRGHSGKFTTKSLGLTTLLAYGATVIGAYLVRLSEYMVIGA